MSRYRGHHRRLRLPEVVGDRRRGDVQNPDVEPDLVTPFEPAGDVHAVVNER